MTSRLVCRRGRSYATQRHLPPESTLPIASAFAVHILTASGTACALLALVAASRGAFVAMFLWLGLAFAIDGIDGPLARRQRVKDLVPRWSGDTLDLVVDYLTYVFIPAYVVIASGLFPEWLALTLGVIVVVTGALYFGDTGMKLEGNYFRGFPALWNVIAFYLLLLKPAPWLGAGMVVLFAVLTFVPFPFVHPVRVVRLRALTLGLLLAWSVLAAFALYHDLAPPLWVQAALAAIGLYFLCIGLTDRRNA